jgi:outer membrane protein OmpA-like peptidoglycan-associated protein
MRTYRSPFRGRPLRHSLVAGFLLLLCTALDASAQERKYLVEIGAAGVYQSFADVTQLGGAAGGAGRIGLWLPAHFSVEGEGSVVGSEAKIGGTSVSVKTFSLSALYNFLLGPRNTLYLKAGGGTTRYGSDCPGPSEPAPDFACGSIGTLVLATGARIALTPTLMVRGEGQFNRNSGESRKFSNVGLNLGLSLMVGSKPIDDSDGDGVLNNRDRCANTPSGAQVDSRGCPSDDDNDGVPNGVDRCPTTSVGATVDAGGCTRDSDGDNIADGLDRCPDTPAGVLVDPRGCPKDSDEDSIADGIDRCSDTPRGATVDALGCPGDEDGDGVLDGLDRCPRSPVGMRVSPAGCAPGQDGGRQTPAAPAPTVPQPSAGRPSSRQPAVQPAPTQQPPAQQAAPRPAPAAADTGAPARPGTITPGIIPGIEFAPGTARLVGGSYVALDSIVRILLASPTLRVEVGAHTDNSATSAENLRLTNLQAEAVRNYLVTKGVPFQQVLPRGYGATVPLSSDNSPRGRAANRRIEIRPTQAGP